MVNVFINQSSWGKDVIGYTMVWLKKQFEFEYVVFQSGIKDRSKKFS